MKKVIFSMMFVMVMTCAGLVRADETTTVAQDPQGAYASLKEIVDHLNPQAEALMSFKNMDFFDGFSASLYKLEPNKVELVDARGGYALDKIGYASVCLNLANLGQRYLPEKFNAFFDSIPLPFHGKVAKYGRLGFWTGWDFGQSEPDGGATFGIKVPLP